MKKEERKDGTCAMCWRYKPMYGLCFLKFEPVPKKMNDTCSQIDPISEYDESGSRRVDLVVREEP